MGGRIVAVRLLGGAARRALEAGRGGPAKAALDATGGEVLAVFRRSFYLQLGPEALVCFGGAELEPGPLNGLWDVDLGPLDRVITPGASVTLRGQTLAIAGGGRFDWRGAVPWRPRPARAGWTLPDLAEGLARLAPATPPGDGLCLLIPILVDHRRPPVASADDPLLRQAWPAVVALRGWLIAAPGDSDGTSGDPSEEVAGLLGLGPGSTPAGDDLLGGAMIALHTLGAPASARRLAAWVLRRAEGRTGRISRAHLAAAAAGEGAGALHQVLATITTPGTPGLQRALDALDRVGHRSGWDALTGVVLAGVAWLDAGGDGAPAAGPAEPLSRSSFCPTTGT